MPKKKGEGKIKDDLSINMNYLQNAIKLEPLDKSDEDDIQTRTLRNAAPLMISSFCQTNMAANEGGSMRGQRACKRKSLIRNFYNLEGNSHVDNVKKPSKKEKRRLRGANFTEKEVTRMIDIIKEYGEVIESKENDVKTWKKKQSVWEEIHARFNVEFMSSARTQEQLRKKYETLKKLVRKKVTIAEWQRQCNMLPGTVSFSYAENVVYSLLLRMNFKFTSDQDTSQDNDNSSMVTRTSAFTSALQARSLTNGSSARSLTIFRRNGKSRRFKRVRTRQSANDTISKMVSTRCHLLKLQTIAFKENHVIERKILQLHLQTMEMELKKRQELLDLRIQFEKEKLARLRQGKLCCSCNGISNC